MAVGQENGRAVLAHDGAGRAGRVVGNGVFREILIVNGKRAARQEGEILARSGNVQNLLADWKRAEHCPVIPDGQGGIAVSGLIEIHDERDEAVSVQRVVLEIGVLKGVAAEALAVQLIEIQRVFTQDAERVSGQEMQIVDQGISDGDGAENFLRIRPEEDDRGLEHPVLLPEGGSGGVFCAGGDGAAHEILARREPAVDSACWLL